MRISRTAIPLCVDEAAPDDGATSIGSLTTGAEEGSDRWLRSSLTPYRNIGTCPVSLRNGCGHEDGMVASR
jgi:hypothetical protein